jgi:5'-nucleotidase
MLNVNFPSCPPENIRGTKITGQGITPFNDYYEERISPSGRKYFWLYGEKPVLQKKNDDDTILAEKFVTIAPLILDMTDNTLVNKYCAENNGILNL